MKQHDPHAAIICHARRDALAAWDAAVAAWREYQFVIGDRYNKAGHLYTLRCRSDAFDALRRAERRCCALMGWPLGVYAPPIMLQAASPSLAVAVVAP